MAPWQGFPPRVRSVELSLAETGFFQQMETKIQNIVFWQNILSIHQSAFVRALADWPGIRVTFAYEEDLPESRKAMGWTIPNYGAAQLVDVRDQVQWNRLVALNDLDTCHVFGSYFRLPRAYAAFRHLRHAPCRRAWTTEAFDYYGWRGWLRLQRARWHVYREARAAFHRVFAMGDLGVKFFRRVGVHPEQLREFAYLVEPPISTPPPPEPDRAVAGCRFLFVGQLIHRKGVDLLLRAVSRLPESGWSLDLIGDGADRESLQAFVVAHGLSGSVRFCGNQSNAVVLAALQSADVLILPSRWDGWGAVVNEALMLGTPVIVSDACGAASLIVNNACGTVFRRADHKDLYQALQAVLDRGTIAISQRVELRTWAQQTLGGLSLSRYFFESFSINATDLALPPWKA